MLLWILGILAAVVIGVPALVAGVGMLLPRGHVASRTVDLPAPPARVWTALTDWNSYPSWRSDVRSVEAFAAPADSGGGGAPASASTGWAETGRHGKTPFIVERSDEPRELVVRIADPKLPFGGSWTYELTATDTGGTRLTITERGEVYNPVFRCLGHFFFDPAATIERYQRELRAHMSTPPAPPPHDPA